jgi:putative tricarboxylic transport membrane protein
MIVASVLMLIIGYFGMRGFIKMLSIPKHILLPVVFIVCAVGAFGINNRGFDVWCLGIFGLAGFLFNAFSIPVTPLIIAFVITPICEVNLRRGLQMSLGSYMPFLERPISALFILTAVVFAGYNVYKYFRNKKSKQ